MVADRSLTRMAAAVVASAAFLVGCGSSNPGASTGATATTAPGASAAASNRVEIHNFSFQPTPLEVKAGTTLEVDNQDSTAHTVTADDRSFDTGAIAAHGTSMITLNHPGTFTYHCAIHNYMQGVIRVSG